MSGVLMQIWNIFIEKYDEYFKLQTSVRLPTTPPRRNTASNPLHPQVLPDPFALIGAFFAFAFSR